MSDAESTSDAAAQAAAAAAAQEATSTERPGGDGGEETISAGDAKRLRAEAASYRKQLREAETKLRQREEADLSEKEKADRARSDAEGRASELEKEVRELRVQVLAPEAGIKPSLSRAAYALIDWNSVDDPSDPKQVKRALQAVAKEYPDFASAQSADGGAGRGEQDGGSVTDMNELVRRRVGRGAS